MLSCLPTLILSEGGKQMGAALLVLLLLLILFGAGGMVVHALWYVLLIALVLRAIGFLIRGVEGSGRWYRWYPASWRGGSFGCHPVFLKEPDSFELRRVSLYGEAGRRSSEAEQLFCKQPVVGSIPTAGSKIPKRRN